MQNAEFLVGLIADLPLASPEARHVRNALNAWDLNAGDGEGPAFFYEFERRLAAALFTPALRDPAAVAGISRRSLYRLLERPGPLEPARSLAAAVEKSLQGTYEAYRDRTRKQEDGWHWEILHTVGFRHPLGTIVPCGPFLSAGPSAPAAGSTACWTPISAARFKTSRLAAYKMILDFSDFSGSLLAIPRARAATP